MERFFADPRTVKRVTNHALSNEDAIYFAWLLGKVTRRAGYWRKQMHAATAVFPFRQTFRRLELERRWWHRLCIVVFFLLSVVTAVFAGWITYAAFAPRVQTMPEIATIVAGLPANADIDAILAALPENAGLPHGYYLDHSISLKDLGRDIKAKYPEYDDLGDEALATLVLAKYPQYSSVVSDGGQRASTNNPPGSAPGFEPVPVMKTIRMPDDSVARFSATVSDGSIRARWSHAERRQTLTALSRAALFTVISVLLISYLLQSVYRVLLYVIFGSAV